MVEEIWKRISRMKGEHIPKVLRIYSKYLIDIFNDRRAGNELLDKANKMDQNYNYQRDLFQNISVESNIDGQEDGLIYMTMDEVAIRNEFYPHINYTSENYPPLALL